MTASLSWAVIHGLELGSAGVIGDTWSDRATCPQCSQQGPRIGKTSIDGKRAVGNTHAVCDQAILLCKRKKASPRRNDTGKRGPFPTRAATTGVEGDTDRAGSPGNRRPRPECLPAADAAGGGAAGTQLAAGRPCRRPGPRQPRALRGRPRITPRSNRTNHHALPVPASARSEGRAQAPVFFASFWPVHLYARCRREVKKKLEKKWLENQNLSPAAPRNAQTRQTFANRQSRAEQRKDEGRKTTAETRRLSFSASPRLCGNSSPHPSGPRHESPFALAGIRASERRKER